MACPMIRSDSPIAYASALSKKFTPASWAASMQSRALPTSSWLPKLTQEPNDSTLTWRPDLPNRRCSMGPVYRGVPDIRSGSDSRSEEHTSELQSLMRISYAVFCLKKKNTHKTHANIE